MRVLKFGGSSLADAERFLRVADIAVNTHGQSQVALVLSAPAKVTNHLVALVEQTSRGMDASATLFEINGIFSRLLAGLKAAYPALDDKALQSRLTNELDQVERLMQGIRLLGLCPDNVQARILSRGENLSIAFMHELLRVRGLVLDLIVPEQLLVTDGGYLEAHVDIEASRLRFAAKGLRSDCLYLMPGFTGGSDKGETVLLGRNGSDYSAAVLAACVDAECCEIWTDVEGCYNCDPRLVPDAYLLKTLSYKEAMELSYFGAKVLHPKTIAPVAQFHIPCLIKNSFNPQGPGTLIGVEQGDDDLKVKAISDLSGMCMFNVSGPGMKGMVGMAGRIFSAVSRAGVSIVLITQSSSEYSVSFCIHSYDSEKTRKVLEREFELEFKNQLLEPLDIISDLAIISLIGDGMRTSKGMAARFFMPPESSEGYLAASSAPSSTSASLSAGLTSPCTSSIPRRLPTACAVVRPSPVAITTRMLASRSEASASAVVALTGSDTASRPARVRSTARCMTLAPCPRSASASVASGDTSTPSCCISAVLPSASCCEPTTPCTPMPDSESNCSGLSSTSPCCFAAATMAAASGCSLPWSRLAASRSTSSASGPSATDTTSPSRWTAARMSPRWRR